jgi:transglutaminase-like putative cysteine protease
MDRGELRRFARHANLQLPPGRNPRALELAERLWAENPAPLQMAERVLRLFREEPFYYTLNPPLLGANAVDDFLFNSRQGFCEHYASAFVVLMRAAGVPARAVTGYLGGEVNPVDQVLTVRQSAAHAWAEI